MQNRYKIKYDIKSNTLTDIKFKRGDINSSVIEVKLLDNGTPIDITGEDIEFRFLKPDKTVVFQDFTTGVSVSNPTLGEFECVLMANTLGAAGMVFAEVVRKKNGAVLTSPTFSFMVDRTIEGAVLSSNYIASIDSKMVEWADKEIIRVDAEDLRVEAETNRADAEASRVTAEAKRVNNETSRVDAEDLRATAFAGYEDRIDTVENDLVAHKEDYVQLDNEVKELAYITQKYTIDSWDKVQEIVRAGLADKAFKIGDQFVANYNGEPVTWDIIGINHDKPTDPNFKYSLTIQSHDCLLSCQFDEPEPDNPYENIKLYGNNNYKNSNIRQWLNSNQDIFEWISQHEFDVAPTTAPYIGAGFLKLLDADLVKVLGKVDKQVATYPEGQDLFSDKVFLLSRVEIYGGPEGYTTGEVPYKYYSSMGGEPTADSVDWRIKYLSGSPRHWWVRSPLVGYPDRTRSSRSTGDISSSFSNSDYGVTPACVII